MDRTMNVSQIRAAIGTVIAEVTGWLWMITTLAIAVIFFASVAKLAGYPIRMMPAIDPTPLAYLCGAYWLARK